MSGEACLPCIDRYTYPPDGGLTYQILLTDFTNPSLLPFPPATIPPVVFLFVLLIWACSCISRCPYLTVCPLTPPRCSVFLSLLSVCLTLTSTQSDSTDSRSHPPGLHEDASTSSLHYRLCGVRATPLTITVEIGKNQMSIWTRCDPSRRAPATRLKALLF